MWISTLFVRETKSCNSFTNLMNNLHSNIKVRKFTQDSVEVRKNRYSANVVSAFVAQDYSINIACHITQIWQQMMIREKRGHTGVFKKNSTVCVQFNFIFIFLDITYKPLIFNVITLGQTKVITLAKWWQ